MITGPYYWKFLKSGELRYVEGKPKGKHIVEYLERIDYFGQDKMHYLSGVKTDGVIARECDYRSVCGYDRGPRFNVFLKLMWEKL